MISIIKKRQLIGLSFIFCLIALCMMFISCAHAEQYKVSGTINGLPDGTILQLTPMSHDNDPVVGETTVQGGKFEFNGTREFPLCVRLNVKDSYGGKTFMLENTNITINGEAKKTDSSGDAPIYRFDAKVTGSPLTDKLESYIARRSELDAEHEAYYEKYDAIVKAYGAARQAKDKAKIEEISNSDEYKAFSKAEHEFFQKVEKTFTDIITENKDTYWGPMMAIYLYSYFTTEQKPLFESFSKEAQESYYGKKMIDEIMPAGNTGEPAKELKVKGDDGKELTLAQLCEGKKVVLIDFWASWCVPCRKEIPNVKKQYALYKDKGFQVVSISIDKSVDAWKKALAEEKLEWPNYRDILGAADLYKVRSIPAMFLINAENNTVICSGEDARGTALAAKLEELFK